MTIVRGLSADACLLPAARCELFPNTLRAASCVLPAARWFSARYQLVGGTLPAACCQLPAGSRPAASSHFSPLPAGSQPAAHCQLPAASCQLVLSPLPPVPSLNIGVCAVRMLLGFLAFIRSPNAT